MKKQTFLESLRLIYEYIATQTVVKDLLVSFCDESIKDFFINHSINIYKSNMVDSFKIINNFLLKMVKEESDIYPVANELINDISIICNNESLIDELNDSDFVEIAKYNCALSLFLCSISLVLDPLDNYEDFKNNFANERNLYFRGQCDSSFGLLPSFYRDLSIHDDVITIKTVEEKYKEYGFYQRYQNIFSSKYKKIETNYSMMSYVQHSAAYSPLLDITKSMDVAAFFACSGKNINPNTYFKKDSSIFIFKLLKENHKRQTKLKIKWFENKVDFNSVLVKDKFLFECSPNDFLISYSLMNKTTNDRMNYQNGAFLFIEEGIIINKHLLIPIDQILIVKIVIPARLKRNIYSYVISHNETLSEDYIFDPYSYLSNYTKI